MRGDKTAVVLSPDFGPDSASLHILVLSTLSDATHQSVARAMARIGSPAISAGTFEHGAVADRISPDVTNNPRDYVLFIGQDCSVSPEALITLLHHLNAYPEIEAGFARQVLLPSHGRKHPILIKPDFLPEWLRGDDYIGPVALFRVDVLTRALPSASRHGAGFVYALLLFAARNNVDVRGLDIPIYSIPDPESALGIPLADSVREHILREHLDAIGGGVLQVSPQGGAPVTRRALAEQPLVSLLIPSRGIYTDGHSYLVNCLRSVYAKTTYPHFEVVVVVDEGFDADLVAEIQSFDRGLTRFVLWTEPFSFSRKMNFGAFHTRGEYILHLNDDVEVITADWIEALLGLAQLPHVGMAGAMLYYEDDTIQHGAHALYHGSPTHVALNFARNSPGPLGALRVEREVVGVTAACALMRRSVFDEAGGFSQLYPGNFNDVDLCLKVRSLGYTICWTPFAELYHFESKTRDAHVHHYELDTLARRWAGRMHDTTYWPWSPDNHDGIQGG
jgi:GT2 family glycosyltransferase